MLYLEDVVRNVRTSKEASNAHVMKATNLAIPRIIACVKLKVKFLHILSFSLCRIVLHSPRESIDTGTITPGKTPCLSRIGGSRRSTVFMS